MRMAGSDKGNCKLHDLNCRSNIVRFSSRIGLDEQEVRMWEVQLLLGFLGVNHLERGW